MYILLLRDFATGTFMHQEVYIRMFIAALFAVTKVWQGLKFSWTIDWISKFSAMKMNKPWLLSSIWLNFTTIMLNEKKSYIKE